MKRSVLIFSPLIVVVVLVFILLRPPTTEPPPPSAVSFFSGSLPLPQQLEKSSQIQTIQSAGDEERLSQLAYDQYRAKVAGEKSREDHNRQVADKLNGESFKQSVAALFKEWGEDDKTLQKTLDVYYNMDMQNLRELQRLDLETPLEVGDRTDPAKVQASKEKHAINNALIIEAMNTELLAILGSVERRRKVTALKYDMVIKAADASTSD